MRKPVVGESLFLVKYFRRGGGRQRDCIVTKVGRKYFCVKETIDSYLEVQFFIKSWRENTDYESQYSIYESRGVWEAVVEVGVYLGLFREAFRHRGGSEFTLDQLKKAAEILGINPKKEDKNG